MCFCNVSVWMRQQMKYFCWVLLSFCYWLLSLFVYGISDSWIIDNKLFISLYLLQTRSISFISLILYASSLVILIFMIVEDRFTDIQYSINCHHSQCLSSLLYLILFVKQKKHCVYYSLRLLICYENWILFFLGCSSYHHKSSIWYTI